MTDEIRNKSPAGNIPQCHMKINTQKSGLFLTKSNFTQKMIPKNPGIAKK